MWQLCDCSKSTTDCSSKFLNILRFTKENLFLSMEEGVKNIRIFEYIQIFSDTNICLYHFLIQIYSDIRLYHFFDTNIFKRKNLTCALKSPKVKWLKLFTHRLIYKQNYFPLFVSTMF